jgi:hypothetical protein
MDSSAEGGIKQRSKVTCQGVKSNCVRMVCVIKDLSASIATQKSLVLYIQYEIRLMEKRTTRNSLRACVAAEKSLCSLRYVPSVLLGAASVSCFLGCACIVAKEGGLVITTSDKTLTASVKMMTIVVLDLTRRQGENRSPARHRSCCCRTCNRSYRDWLMRP